MVQLFKQLRAEQNRGSFLKLYVDDRFSLDVDKTNKLPSQIHSLRCSHPTHSSKPFVYTEGLERLRRRQQKTSLRRINKNTTGQLTILYQVLVAVAVVVLMFPIEISLRTVPFIAIVNTFCAYQDGHTCNTRNAQNAGGLKA